MSQMQEVERRLRAELPALEIRNNEPMSRHTSFNIGGPVDLMLLPRSVEELKTVLRLLHESGEKPWIFGAGTNVLVPDEGLRGAAIVTRDALCKMERDGTRITAESGVTLAKLALYAAECGLTGLEFAQGIPGTVGGGVFMNAGAYDGELRLTAAATTVLTLDGAEMRYEGAAQGFGYRTSAFQSGGLVIVRTEFQLEQGDREAIRAKMQDFAHRRVSKQPLEYPSAGSTFKRPQGHFAGALIEAAGLKGLRVGGAMVSEKHAGFVINAGGATAADVLSLVAEVQKRVYDHSGVLLEPEVRLLRRD